MGTLSPNKSVDFAAGVYGVRNELSFKDFMAQPEFSQMAADNKIISASVGSRLLNTKDNFALCARGIGIYKDDVFLIFRGTTKANKRADWFTDGRIGLQMSLTGSLVHSGFNHTFTSMVGDLSDFLSQHSDAVNVHCIGHSLGGAVATLVADWVKDKYSKKVKLYTYGCPRVGLGFTGFANKVTINIGKENIHRVYHETDAVPMVPVFPYVHAPQPGEGYYFPFSGKLISGKAHSILNYARSVSGSEWATMGTSSSGIPSHITLKQWLMSDELVSISDARVWEKMNFVFRHLFQTFLAAVQPAFIAGFTLADQLALMLHRGISISLDAADWVFHLIRKMMQMLGMKLVETIEQLTEALMRAVLKRIVSYISREAIKALDNILN